MISYKALKHKSGKGWVVGVYDGERLVMINSVSVFPTRDEAVEWAKKLELAKPRKQVKP